MIPTDRPSPATPSGEAGPHPHAPVRGHVGRVVALTMLGGLLAATLGVLGPFAGAEEHIIIGSVLMSFALSWALLAVLTTRLTDQPQRWAAVPAAVMAVAATAALVTSPSGNRFGWVWPPVMLVLAVWVGRRARRELRSRARVLVVYPVIAGLVLASLGGAYETIRASDDPTVGAMPGRLVSVGDHRLHIDCTGSGSPVVVLEAGLGEPSTMMASWLAPQVASAGRVCVYDRAGRGWSDAASGPQDGEQIATDLHTLLRNAGERGPYVLAGHSAGGIYVLNFARMFPGDVAGVALLDSMHPEQYDRVPSWPGFYAMFRRFSAVMSPLARVGLVRIAYGTQYGDLPSPQREQERAFLSTPRHNRSIRDEFSQIRTAMDQAAQLDTLGDKPLLVVTAESGADEAWPAAQDHLASLSTQSIHRFLPEATHAMLVEDESSAREVARAIRRLVDAIRGASSIDASGDDR